MPSPITLVDGYSTTTGFNTVDSTTLIFSLADYTGVNAWTLTCIGSDDKRSVGYTNGNLVYNSLNKTYHFTIPEYSRGCALIFRSTINGALDLDGNYRNDYLYDFEVFSIGPSGNRLIALNQTTQNDPSGWGKDINSILANGLSGSGDLEIPNLTAGSISVDYFIPSGGEPAPTTLLGGVELQTRLINSGSDGYVDYTGYDRVIFCKLGMAVLNYHLYLPAPYAGRVLTVINEGVNHLYINIYNGETILDNQAGSPHTQITLNSHKSVTLISDGTNWFYETS